LAGGSDGAPEEDAYYFGSNDFPCIHLGFEEFFSKWRNSFENNEYNDWEETIGPTISCNEDHRQILGALLAALGYERAEDVFATFPFLKDDMIEDTLDEACDEYVMDRRDYQSDGPVLPPIPMPEGTADDDCATMNRIHEANWYQEQRSSVDNLVRRRLRRLDQESEMDARLVK